MSTFLIILLSVIVYFIIGLFFVMMFSKLIDDEPDNDDYVGAGVIFVLWPVCLLGIILTSVLHRVGQLIIKIVK